MDHCPLRARALWHFFESAPDQLSGDGLFGALQLNETLGQKTHAPALFAFGRLRAGQSDQMGLLLSIELVGFGGLGPAVDQCRLQPLPGEPLAHPSDRRAAYLQSIGDLGGGPGVGFVGSIFALVGLEQDARMGQLARRGVATSDQAFQLAAILPGQAHGVVPLPRHREASSCSLPRGRSHERRHSSYPRRNIAANQSCQDTSNITFSGTGEIRTATIKTRSGRTGTSTVTITLTEGQMSASVAVTVKAGGGGGNTLNGTSGADLLLAQDGNDTLSALGASDVLCGSNGNDRLSGGSEADTFDGGSGTDTATDYNPQEGDSTTNIP